MLPTLPPNAKSILIFDEPGCMYDADSNPYETAHRLYQYFLDQPDVVTMRVHMTPRLRTQRDPSPDVIYETVYDLRKWLGVNHSDIPAVVLCGDAFTYDAVKGTPGHPYFNIQPLRYLQPGRTYADPLHLCLDGRWQLNFCVDQVRYIFDSIQRTLTYHQKG